MDSIEEIMDQIKHPLAPHNITTFDPKTLDPKKPILNQVISDMKHWGDPKDCPSNFHRFQLLDSNATITSMTSYGGPGSKYRNINEDSFFFGKNQKGKIVAGTIDGSGGSHYGYLAGKVANYSLSNSLIEGLKLDEAFYMADANVIKEARGGYATAVALTITPDHNVQIACKGDSRSLAIRKGNKIESGCTLIQSHVGKMIEKEELKPSEIHTHKKKNIVYSVIGNHKLPLCLRRFQAQKGDQIILATDGLWDVVSDYEIQYLSQILHGVPLLMALFHLAYQRNNSKENFYIQFSKEERLEIPALYPNDKVRRGDNITIQLIEI